jgi:hypothetical protein
MLTADDFFCSVVALGDRQNPARSGRSTVTAPGQKMPMADVGGKL